MARDADEHNASAWLLLRAARELVAENTRSTTAAEELLCSYLTGGYIHWRYKQCGGEWQPLDPIVIRSPLFWRADLPYRLAIDWDASRATRTGPANTIIKRIADPNHPEGFRTLAAADLQTLVAMAQRGKLPVTNYTVSLIQLHRGDVLNVAVDRPGCSCCRTTSSGSGCRRADSKVEARQAVGPGREESPPQAPG